MRLIFLFIIFCFCFSNCFAEELKKIEVHGLQRLAQKDVLSIAQIQIGSDITHEQLNSLLKNLHETGLFEDIAISMHNGLLKINAKERPILFDFIISGNKAISSKDIIKALELKKDSIFNQEYLDKNIKKVQALYNAKGRINTKIDYELTYKSPGVIKLLISIKEARSLKISSIKFFGNEQFMDFDLKRIIPSKEFSILRILGSSYYYVKERKEVDIEILKRFYQSSGYFDFRVDDVKFYKEGENVFLEFYLYEGIQYKFGTLDINQSIDGLNDPDIKKIIDIKTGNVFNVKDIDRISAQIIDYLNDKGYLFVNIRPEYSVNEESVDIVFNILDAKKIYVNNIKITGNNRTKDRVIRSEILISERDPHSQSKMSYSRMNLFGLGFFDAVDFTYEKIDDQNIDIYLKVKERTTGYVNLSGGYGSDTGIFGNIGYTEANLLGTGNKMAISLKRSVKDFDASFDFTKTKIFDTKITAQFALFTETSDRQEESSYKQSVKGFKIGMGYDITDRLHQNIFYSFKSVNIYDVESDASESVKDQYGKKDISLIGYALTHNLLDNPFAPTSGHFAKLSQSFAGIGGDLNFVRSEYKINYFKTLIPSKKGSIVLNLASKGGYVFGYGDQDVRIGQRFFLSDVRGFDSAGIGPRDIYTKDALGGKAFLFNTVQVEFPIGLPKEVDIKGSVFFDNAILTSLDHEGPNIIDSQTFRNSIGFGFVWGSPFGRLRVDFGWPVTKEDFDKTKFIKFGIMTATS